MRKFQEEPARSAILDRVKEPFPVLLLVRELNLGGCERDVTKIATRLDRSKFSPHVGCFRPEGIRRSELEESQVPVVSFPVTSFRSPSMLKGALAFGRYLKQHRIQLIHSYDVPLTLFAAPWGRVYRTPSIITSQLSYRSLVPPVYRQLLRATDRLADRIVVNCKAMWRHMTDDEGVPQSKLYLCYNGVDTQLFYPKQEERPPSLAGASLVIGCLAALRPEKRIDLLLEAFARVQPLAPGAKLLVVGSGSESSRLQQRAEQLGIMKDCVFQPAQSDVAPWLRAMDIFVLPSSSEAFSNALLEAMACGCCPVGSNVGGTPELIEDGKRGLLFQSGNPLDLANKLALLIRQPELRRTLASTAASFAHLQFSIDIAVERMSDLYLNLIQRASGRQVRF